jgi:hypothetical protein
LVAYKFSYPIAWLRGSGPEAPVTKADKATILIYHPDDTTFTTPITIYANKALTVVTNLISDDDGVCGDFYTNDLPDVVWKSGAENGEWATTQSRPGLRGPVSTTPGPPGPPGANGTNGLNGANASLLEDPYNPGFYFPVEGDQLAADIVYPGFYTVIGS